MREVTVIKSVTEICEIYGAYTIVKNSTNSSLPIDIIVCYKGRFLGVECKAGYNKPTALQEREIAAIHKAGGSAMVVREDTLELLREWFIRETN